MAADAPEPAALASECAVASVGILLLLGVVKHVGAVVPLIHQNAATIAAAAQLYVPLVLVGRRGITNTSLGWTVAGLRSDLGLVALLSLVTIVPFAIGHHFWQTLLFHRVFQPRLSGEVFLTALLQVAVVALPEELYFRGYLQGRMEALWPARRSVLGVPVGAAIVVAALIFALAHFVGEYRFDRLGPFFPALVFGWLRAKTGRLAAPITYHAFCNLLGDVLWTCYRGS